MSARSIGSMRMLASSRSPRDELIDRAPSVDSCLECWRSRGSSRPTGFIGEAIHAALSSSLLRTTLPDGKPVVIESPTLAECVPSTPCSGLWAEKDWETTVANEQVLQSDRRADIRLERTCRDGRSTANAPLHCRLAAWQLADSVECFKRKRSTRHSPCYHTTPWQPYRSPERGLSHNSAAPSPSISLSQSTCQSSMVMFWHHSRMAEEPASLVRRLPAGSKPDDVDHVAARDAVDDADKAERDVMGHLHGYLCLGTLPPSRIKKLPQPKIPHDETRGLERYTKLPS